MLVTASRRYLGRFAVGRWLDLFMMSGTGELVAATFWQKKLAWLFIEHKLDCMREDGVNDVFDAGN